MKINPASFNGHATTIKGICDFANARESSLLSINVTFIKPAGERGHVCALFGRETNLLFSSFFNGYLTALEHEVNGLESARARRLEQPLTPNDCLSLPFAFMAENRIV